MSYASFDASDDAIANMNGQYLMNKDVSVQYAYKKDGKGERHGDEAERMLASQARMHNVVPELQQMPAQLLLNGAGPPPVAVPPLDPSGGIPQQMPGGAPPVMPPGFSARPGMGMPAYGAVPPPHHPHPQHQQQMQQRGPINAPLPPPPSGLPQRPPPSQAGYGGPQDFHPPGFPPPPGAAPMAPPGFPVPGQMPPGFAPGPPGFPPVQQQQQGPPGYARR